MAKKRPKKSFLDKRILLKVSLAAIGFLAIITSLAYASTLIKGGLATVRINVIQVDSAGNRLPLAGVYVKLRDWGVVGSCAGGDSGYTGSDGSITFTGCPVGSTGKHKYTISELSKSGYTQSNGSVYKKDSIHFTVKAYSRAHKINHFNAYMSFLTPVGSRQSLGYSTFILTDPNYPNQFNQQQALVNPRVHLTYRATTPDLTSNGTAYTMQNGTDGKGNAASDFYFTAASSDFGSSEDSRVDPLFIDPNMADQVLRWSHNRGLYLHELVDSQTLWERNADNKWDPNSIVTNDNVSGTTHPSKYSLSQTCCYKTSASSSDLSFGYGKTGWQILNAYAQSAAAQNKKILWSEHSDIWLALYNASQVQGSDANNFFGRWGNVIVPIFATNTDNTQINNALNGAKEMALKIQGELGESAQSFYWSGAGQATDSGTFNLMKIGFDNNASYYEIQGYPPDLTWGSGFMNGVKEFADFLGTQ